jgi:hypothetical protein
VRRASLQGRLLVSLVASLAAWQPLAAQGATVRFVFLPFENTGSYGQDKEVFEGLELALPALLGIRARMPSREACCSRPW